MTLKWREVLIFLFQAHMPVIKKDDADDGWIVSLEGTHKLTPELETAGGGTRIFKTQDAAVGMLFEIEFSEIKIIQ